MGKDPAILNALSEEIESIVQETTDAGLQALARKAGEAVAHARAWASEALGEGPADLEAGARRFALTLGRATELALLVRQANFSLSKGDGRPAAAARRFAEAPFDLVRATSLEDSRVLALG